MCIFQQQTQVEQEKKSEHGLSYDVSLLDAFLDSDLFRRWYCESSSSSVTGNTWVSGSDGYWPAWR